MVGWGGWAASLGGFGMEFKGRWSVDLRELYMDKKTSELKPSPRGISLPAEQWAKLVAGLPALADALAT